METNLKQTNEWTAKAGKTKVVLTQTIDDREGTEIEDIEIMSGEGYVIVQTIEPENLEDVIEALQEINNVYSNLSKKESTDE